MEGTREQNARETDETATGGPERSALSNHRLAPVGLGNGLASGSAGHAGAVPAIPVFSGEILEAATMLRRCQCQVCGILFAVPLTLYSERATQSGSVHCPNGHPNAATADEADRSARGVIVELQQLRMENLQLRRTVSKLCPIAITPKELKRRATVLSERAETLRYGQVLCSYCGNKKRGQSALRNHLLRQHEEDLRLDPVEAFQ